MPLPSKPIRPSHQPALASASLYLPAACAPGDSAWQTRIALSFAGDSVPNVS